MSKLETMTDEQLALAYVEGDNRAFDLLLSRNELKLFSYIMFVVRDQEKANDVFQETFVKVISTLQHRKYVDNGKFLSWCMRIAHNVMMDMYREQRGRHVVDTNETNDLSNIGCASVLDSNAEDAIINQQVLADVKKLMNNLPAVQREVVYMRFYQQLSFKEIAEMTGVSINTSLGRMRYALLNLRRMAREHNLYLQLD